MSKVSVSVFRGEDKESATEIATVPVTKRTTLKTLRGALEKKKLIEEDDEFVGRNGDIDTDTEESTKVLDQTVQQGGKAVIFAIEPNDDDELDVNVVDSGDESDLDVTVPSPQTTPKTTKARQQRFEVTGQLSEEMRTTVASLTDADLEKLIEIAKLGKAYSISGGSPQPRSELIIKELPLPDQANFNPAAIGITIKEAAVYESVPARTERSTTYAEGGWCKPAIDFTSELAPYSKAAAQAEADARNAAKPLAVTTSYLLQRVTLTLPLDSYLVPNPKFKKDIEGAAARRDASERIEQVLQQWGHLFPTTIVLGAARRTTQRFNGVSPGNEAKKIQEVETLLADKVEHGRSNSLDVEIVGGDGRLIRDSEIDQWVKSAAKWQNWRIIEIKNVESVLVLLPPDLREKVVQNRSKSITFNLSNEETQRQQDQEAAASRVEIKERALAGTLKGAATALKLLDQLGRQRDESALDTAQKAAKTLFDGVLDIVSIATGQKDKK